MGRVSGKADVEQQLVRLGNAVRARRHAISMSQEELADRAGLDRSHLGRIERGERNVTLLNLMRVAEALNARASELLADATL